MNTLEMIKNQSFFYERDIPGAIGNFQELTFNISETNTLMTIYKNNEIVDVLSSGAGIALSLREDNSVKLLLAISDISHYEVGEYTYDLKIADKDNNMLIDEIGIIEIKENVTGETINGSIMWDLDSPSDTKVSREHRLERLKICYSCPQFNNNVCLECGCWMPIKTTLKDSQCPINKW